MLNFWSNLESCPTEGNCRRRDSRGVDWEGFYGEMVYKECPSGANSNGESILQLFLPYLPIIDN